MISRLSKYYAITLTAATLLLSLFFTVSPGRELMVNIFSKLSKASPFYNDGGCIASILIVLFPIITVALSLTIATILTLATKPKKVDDAAAEPSKKSAPKLLSYFMFGSIATIVLTLLVFVFFGDHTSAISPNYLYLIIYLSWGQLIISIICAALIQSGIVMWNASRTVAIILCILSVVGLSSVIIPTAILLDISYSCYEYQYLNSRDDTEAVSEYSEYDNEGAEEDETSVENYLEDLWDNPSDDRKNVKKALDYLIKQFESTPIEDYDNTGKEVTTWGILDSWGNFLYFVHNNDDDSSTEGTPENGERELSVIYDYIKGDNNVIYKAFLSYEELIYDKISSRTYYSSGLSKLANALNMAYTDLLSDDSTDKVSRIAKLMSGGLYESALEYSDDLKLYASKDALAFFTTAGELDTHLFAWAYSFWARRYQEGTISASHKILNRIFEHYDDY